MEVKRLQEAMAHLHASAMGDVADFIRDALHKDDPSKNLLTRADQLTGAGGERREAYNHPIVDFRCTAALWTAILQRGGLLTKSQALEAEHVPVMMAALKISRLSGNLKHEDSALDIAGYMRTLEMVWEARNA